MDPPLPPTSCSCMDCYGGGSVGFRSMFLARISISQLSIQKRATMAHRQNAIRQGCPLSFLGHIQLFCFENDGVNCSDENAYTSFPS